MGDKSGTCRLPLRTFPLDYIRLYAENLGQTFRFECLFFLGGGRVGDKSGTKGIRLYSEKFGQACVNIGIHHIINIFSLSM